jgi:serine protease Do
LGLGKPRGALVRNVEAGGPADKAGIEAGDIILRFNNRDIEKGADLPRTIGETKPGNRVPVQVWRKGGLRELSVLVAEVEERAVRRAEARSNGEPATVNVLGLAVSNLSEARQRELKLRGGVEVEAVDGSAARAGIRPGDILTRLGDTDIASVQQFESLIKVLDRNKSVAIFVRRGDVTQVAVIRPR